MNDRCILDDDPRTCPHKDHCLLAFACQAAKGPNAAHFKIERMREGEIRLKGTQRTDVVHVVQAGAVAMVSFTPEGDYNIFGHFGECRVMFPGRLVVGTDPGMSFMAMSDTRICTIDIEFVRKMAAGFPERQFNIEKALIWEAGYLILQLWIMNGSKVKNRVKRFLFLTALSQMNSDDDMIRVKVTHSTIALVTNSKREVISKILKQLLDEGFIEMSYKQIVVRNPRTFFPDDTDTPTRELLATFDRMNLAKLNDQQ